MKIWKNLSTMSGPRSYSKWQETHVADL